MVTGHTGFKGSWLSLWLDSLGAHVIGLALDPPSEPNHWTMLGLPIGDYRRDIRNAHAVNAVVADQRPEIVFHLAAQSLVRRSYQEPLDTWATNVMGTVNVLEAARRTSGVKAVVIVTTDKCYENRKSHSTYSESDRLGGHDPYSASKAGAELAAASYRSAFFDTTDGALIATARGGNVVGGGDWSQDRLIPDLVRSLVAGEPLIIRSPRATRPWQHVLDCLSGYLQLGQCLAEGDRSFAQAWNFGPNASGNHTVGDVLADLQRDLPQSYWQVTTDPQPHEAGLLQIDSAKARSQLGWQPVWDYKRAIHHTAVWYRKWLESGEVTSRAQLAGYCADASAAGAPWAMS
ncbi:MAG: CDP-glucose 4,6-dehydratase [Mycobacterium sp.]